MSDPKRFHRRIYIPNYWLNLMMPIYLLIFVVIVPLFLVYTDLILGSTIPLFFYIGLSAIFTIIWFITYLSLKRFVFYVSVQNKSLKLLASKKIKEYLLETIKEFNLKTTYYSLAGAGLTKIEFGFTDNNGNILYIYSTDWGKFLKKRWVKFGKNITEITKKKFIFSYFIEDTDGKLYPAEEFHRKFWKKMHKILP